MKIPCESQCNMCNLFKSKSKSCVMLLLRHAAAQYIIFLTDDAQCIGKSRERGVDLGKMPVLDQFLNSPPLISLPLSSSSSPGDGEASGG